MQVVFLDGREWFDTFLSTLLIYGGWNIVQGGMK